MDRLVRRCACGISRRVLLEQKACSFIRDCRDKSPGRGCPHAKLRCRAVDRRAPAFADLRYQPHLEFCLDGLAETVEAGRFKPERARPGGLCNLQGQLVIGGLVMAVQKANLAGSFAVWKEEGVPWREYVANVSVNSFLHRAYE